MVKKSRRPFATGSKPGPDAIDHYLEEQGFYRKHVARDPSSLFRVVSENILDVQEYHTQVRQDCATFMEDHSKDYANEVDKNFYNYIASLRKIRTSGTLLELRVMARMYKKSVILFEPNSNNTQTTQCVYVQAEEDNSGEPMRIFYSHKDKHFDVVYTMDYVECLAETQSLVYEILYVDVFKLPDVMYAVERMLHDQKGEFTLPLEDNESKYSTANGDIASFDSALSTNCVLKDPKTCHFHNQVNFEEIVQKNQDAIVIINRSDDPGHLKIFKPTDGYLYKIDISCVRQLLEENITPFPYKVAKALDPSIYRNTEFELWQETRQVSRLKWMIDDKYPMYGNDPRFNPYQMMPYDTGCMPMMMEDPSLEKKFAYVTSNDCEFSSKGKFDNYLPGYDHKFDNIVPPREALEPIIMPMQAHHQQNNFRPNYRNGGRRTFYSSSRYNNYNSNANNNRPGNEERGGDRFHSTDQEQQQVYSQQPVYVQQPQNSGYVEGGYQYVQFPDQISPPPVYPGTQQAFLQFIPQSPYQPVQMAYPQQSYFSSYQAPPPNFENPPPQIVQISSSTTPLNAALAKSDTNNVGDCLNLVREGELNSNINFHPKESTESNGNDLPTNDMSSLQFFYNLGVRYFLSAGLDRRLDAVTAALENLSVRQEVELNTEVPKNDHQAPPVPNNTPVVPKPLHMSNSGNNHSNAHGGNRHPLNYRESYRDNRRFNQNRDGGYNNNNNNGGGGGYKGRNPIPGYQHSNSSSHGNNRKEIQFNSNVKNVHKADSNLLKAASASNFQSSSPNNNGNGNQASNAVASEITSTQNNNLDTKRTLINTNSSSSPESSANSAESVGYSSEQSNNRPNLIIPPPQQVQVAQSQTPQYYPVQAYAAPQTHPQYALCYTPGAEGDLYQYPQQPVYYAPPQTPIYYQPQPQQSYMSQSMYTNDSGVSDTLPYNSNPYSATPQPVYAQYYQTPGLYYPPAPQMVASPQVIVPSSTSPSYPITATISSISTTVMDEEVSTTNKNNNQTKPDEKPA